MDRQTGRQAPDRQQAGSSKRGKRGKRASCLYPYEYRYDTGTDTVLVLYGRIYLYRTVVLITEYVLTGRVPVEYRYRYRSVTLLRYESLCWAIQPLYNTSRSTTVVQHTSAVQ